MHQKLIKSFSNEPFYKKNKKNNFTKFIFIIFFLQNIIIIVFIIFKFNIKIHYYKNFKDILTFQNKNSYNKEMNLDYNYSFAIIKRNNCTNGLFGYYVAYLGCLNKFIKNGYIPILDLLSFPNIFNAFNKIQLNENPWELFFNQPFDFKLKDVINYSKNIIYFNCNPKNRPDTNIYNNKMLLNYWHNLAEKYIPIKNEIIDEAKKIRKYLFNNSINVLGILIRGTDYISIKPKGHPIQPRPEVVIHDAKRMDKKNKYDFFFLTTEDDIIRNKFILELGNKLKFIKSNENIKYNYKKKEYLAFNNKIKGNSDYIKIYLINIIILSKCIDIICSRTAGSVGAFIFSNGFRNTKVYYLGRYQ